MYSIIYIIPYFGKLPHSFSVWLGSCKRNPTIKWLIFTDDHTSYHYPDNVKVVYCTFTEIRERIQKKLPFPIALSEPYKLCDFKVAYGLAFADYTEGYDFWGFCDIDLIWGDIRSFFTEKLLSTYDKIGYQGHSTLFHNTDRINRMFLERLDNECFEELVKSDKNMFIDEDFINRIFESNGITTYREPIFANLSPFVANFKINHLRPEDRPKNKHFIFSYENGKLYRVAVVKGKIVKDPYLYVHFLKRDMSVDINPNDTHYLIVPNSLIPYQTPTIDFINNANKPHAIRFAIRHFRENAHKLNWHTFFPILWTKVKGYYKLFTKC